MMLAVLARASLEGAIVAALVWTVIRWLPRLSPATRTALWWCAAAKFLLALVWVTPVELRVLPPRAETPGAVSGLTAAATGPIESRTKAQVSRAIDEPANDAGVNWPAIVLVLWGAGLVSGAFVDLRRLTRTRRVMRRSSPATEQTAATAAELAAIIGLRRAPAVHVSSETTTPLVVGVLRPRILLPGNGAATLSEGEERMALCHELSHVKRADLWLGLVPAAAERLFFFHPLVRLASREYLLCREAACDAAVLDTLATTPQDYGRLLLALGVSRHRSSLAVAGASSSCSMLKRRIAMLRDSSPSTVGRRVISALVIAAAVAAVVPLRLTARAQSPAPTQQAPAATDRAPDWAPLDWSRVWLGPGRAWLSGQPHEGPLPADVEQQKSRGNLHLATGTKDLNYVLLLDNHNANMSGSFADIERARSLRRGGERLLWIRRNGAEFVVRDAKLIDQALEVWRPVGDLGNAQGDLGGKQGALGTQQGALGARQGAFGMQQGILGTKQGEIGGRQAMLSAREQTATTASERRALDDERRRLETESRALEAEMRALDVKMRELDQPMRDLDKEMRALGAQMEALGREMDEASRRAEAQMLELIDRAIATGVADRLAQQDQELQTSSVLSRLDRLSRLSRLDRLGRLERLSRLTRLNRLNPFDWL